MKMLRIDELSTLNLLQILSQEAAILFKASEDKKEIEDMNTYTKFEWDLSVINFIRETYFQQILMKRAARRNSIDILEDSSRIMKRFRRNIKHI